MTILAILELAHPYQGVVTISNEPYRYALARMDSGATASRWRHRKRKASPASGQSTRRIRDDKERRLTSFERRYRLCQKKSRFGLEYSARRGLRRTHDQGGAKCAGGRGRSRSQRAIRSVRKNSPTCQRYPASDRDLQRRNLVNDSDPRPCIYNPAAELAALRVGTIAALARGQATCSARNRSPPTRPRLNGWRGRADETGKNSGRGVFTTANPSASPIEFARLSATARSVAWSTSRGHLFRTDSGNQHPLRLEPRRRRTRWISDAIRST